MKKHIYAYAGALSFIIAGNLGETHSGWWGWWDVPAFIFVMVGFSFMDAYASEEKGQG